MFCMYSVPPLCHCHAQEKRAKVAGFVRAHGGLPAVGVDPEACKELNNMLLELDPVVAVLDAKVGPELNQQACLPGSYNLLRTWSKCMHIASAASAV